MGSLDGIFIADEKDVADLIGKEISFGEVLGKHSDVFGTLDKEDLEVVSEDQDLIQKIEDILGETLGGFNPLDYYEPEEEN
jgi:hypothetical protein